MLDPAVVVAVVAAGLLFLLEMALSVVLAAAAALTPVALRRLSSESGPRLSFLESLQQGWSAQRAAAAILRQLALIGGTLLLVFAADALGWPRPGLFALVLTGVVAVLLLEALAAEALALWDPKAALRRTAFLVRPAYLLLYPVVQPLQLVLGRLARSQQLSEEERDEEQEEEVEAYLEVGEREGILEASESQMMRSIVDLDETLVREIMTPRTDIVALPEDSNLFQAVQTMVQAGHSRLPVYRETIDNVVGILHVRDVLRLCGSQAQDQPIADALLEGVFVPQTMSVAQLLAEMRVGSHIAMVVDEYGGIAGLVTLEDVMEEIVGDIRDEHEPEEAEVRQDREGSWLIDGTAHVEELEKLFDVELGDRDFDTVGGWVVSGFGHVPAPGETLMLQGLQIEVLKADGRRIQLVRVRPPRSTGEARAGP